ncbi:MAG: XdhC family protein [Burkholderiales bacterium]|nr:XdhC family protein [Burkholderiales bacterium]
MLDRRTLDEIERLHREAVDFCVVTIVDGRGSIPQIVGATALFTAEGLAHGTVGGGKLEVACQEKALALLRSGTERSRFERCNLQKDLQMTCGGEVALYFEVHRRDLDWNVAVFGAGHVAQAVCRVLVELECRVRCFDTRQAWLERLPNSPKLEPCAVAQFSDGIGRIVPGADVLLMTMGHSSDLPVLVELAARNPPLGLLGLLGSDSKAAIVRRQLKEQGVSREFIERIVCPLGEKIGNNTPGEIAISAVAHLLKARHERFP